MKTDWYLLRVTNSDETLMRCGPSGFKTIPLRPPTPNSGNPKLKPVPAATPTVHSPTAPNHVGRMAGGERPRATKVVNDMPTTEDPTMRYLRRLGHGVDEAIRANPAPLYVAMDPDRQALFRTVGKTPVDGFLDDPNLSLPMLWKAVRSIEVST